MTDPFDPASLADIELSPPHIEPSADEEAWEAYLDLALDQLGADGSTGLTNAQVMAIEEAVGATLPFEVGLLLVMGTPEGDGWFDWRQDPVEQFAHWQRWVLDGLLFDVEQNDFWSPHFGPRPDKPGKRRDQLEIAFATLPKLFPLYGHRAVPLDAPEGWPSNDGNPVLSIAASDVIVYGQDLAGWLHADFDAPLPTWPTDTDRRFRFWSDLIG